MAISIKVVLIMIIQFQMEMDNGHEVNKKIMQKLWLYGFWNA